MPGGDRTRLPKWAQREMESLERRLAEAIATLSQGEEDSDTIANPQAHFMGLESRPLGTGTTVRFILDKEVRHHYIEARVDDGVLRLSGGEAISIQPSASNTVKIRIGRDL